MDREKHLDKVVRLMIDFEKFQLGADFETYNGSEELAYKDFTKVFNTLKGCNHYFHIIHADLAQIISKESLYDKDTKLKYDKGLEVVKEINLFKNKYFKDMKDEFEM